MVYAAPLGWGVICRFLGWWGGAALGDLVGQGIGKGESSGEG